MQFKTTNKTAKPLEVTQRRMKRTDQWASNTQTRGVPVIWRRHRWRRAIRADVMWIITIVVLVLSVFHLVLGLISVCVGVTSSIRAEVWLAHSVSPIWSGGFVSINHSSCCRFTAGNVRKYYRNHLLEHRNCALIIVNYHAKHTHTHTHTRARAVLKNTPNRTFQ